MKDKKVSELLHFIDKSPSAFHVIDNIKKNFLDNPSGILQITPESIEAFMINRPERIKEVFKGVEYTVYDVVEQDDDWIIFVCNEQINKLYTYKISYMQNKKYFTTKSDIRNKKLDKLLK